MSSFRILVVDDNEPWRERISSMLAARPDFQIIAEASDGQQAVQMAEELKPDLILLDIGLPTLNGIEAGRRISRVLPDAEIVFISQNNDRDIVAAALGGGAKGYVYKPDATKDLLPAVEAVMRGDHFSSTGVRQRRDEFLRSYSPSF